jgi:phosphoribosylformylglycinamidine (FGAM) synthase-like enzyme
LSSAMQDAAAGGLLTGAHDVSDGGLAHALVEASLLNRIGVMATLGSESDPFIALFSESTARMLVTCTDADVDEVLAIAERHDVPVARLGRTGGDAVSVTELFAVSLDELRSAYESTLPQLFG